MTISDVIVEAFRREGVTQTFGLMGEDIAHLVADLSAAGVGYLSSRHEAGAVGMADGFARAGGDIGVALISRGPGLTNASTALVTANRGRSRVLTIVADSPAALDRAAPVATNVRRSHKFVRQTDLLDALGVAHVTLDASLDCSAVLADVIAVVRSGRPVVVNVPMDQFTKSVEPTGATAPPILPATGERSAAAVPDPKSIADVADLLTSGFAAQRPVIVAGRGAVLAGAGPALAELADQIGAVVATTLPATSLFRDDPFSVGIMGTFSTPVATDVFRRADVVLAFGASLNKLTTLGHTLWPTALLVHVDDDADAMGAFVAPELAVTGDARVVGEALTEELRRRDHRSTGLRTAEARDQIAAYDVMAEVRDQSGDDGVDPRLLAAAVDPVLPRERILVIDPGHHMGWHVAHLDIPDPERLFLPLDFGAIGSATPVAVGAALARPDQQVVLAAGDGGAMMILEELDSAVRAKVPLLVLVYNDSGYGAEVHLLDVFGLPKELAKFPPTSFEAVGRALGADALTVSSVDDVKLVADRIAAGLDGPLVVDCRINPAVQADYISSVGLITGHSTKGHQ